MEHKEKHFSLSWFFKWFLDNKAITVFLVTLLLGLNIFILSKISFIFLPVLDFLGVVMLPVILSGLLYYLLNPIVDWMEKHKINRILAISILFVIIGLFIILSFFTRKNNIEKINSTNKKIISAYNNKKTLDEFCGNDNKYKLLLVTRREILHIKLTKDKKENVWRGT